MAESSSGNCLLCSEHLSLHDTVTVKSKGLKTIREFSVKRNDSVKDALKGITELIVHSKCRSDYTKRVKKSENVIPALTPLPRRDSKFDFKSHCVLCATCISAWDLKKKHASVVQTLEFGKALFTACERRTDMWGSQVMGRIECVGRNLFAVEARYHRKCNTAFRDPTRGNPFAPVSLSQASPQGAPSYFGRKVDSSKSTGFELLCKHLEENEECQFSLEDLYNWVEEKSKASVYGSRHLRRLLEAKYGNKILFTDLPGNRSILTFIGTASKVLNAKWYAARREDPAQEPLRIVKMAANIIRDDIRQRFYNCEQFPSIDDIESGGRNMVPTTLSTFLDILIKTGKKGKNIEGVERKCISSAHGLIAAVRPRSFISPIHFGLGVHLHRCFGSRDLLDVLNTLGHCSSYKEVCDFESSVVISKPQSVTADAFVQYIFDNADVNVRTIDGHGTFHVTGAVSCVTPALSVTVESAIPRREAAGTATARGKFGFLPLKIFKRSRTCGLDSVIVKDLRTLAESDPPLLRAAAIRKLDILWLAGFCFSNKAVPSWSGFMEVCTNPGANLKKSTVVPLPFVNLEASNPSAILTCLEFAAEECVKRGQKICPVTFDQPLFHKAMEIILQADSSSVLHRVEIVVRVGGLHTVMNFMGAIGFIMEGSGLSELWELVYARNTVPHMLTGKAYAKALRAHILTQAAVSDVLMEDIHQSTREKCQQLFIRMLESPDSPLSPDDDKLLETVSSHQCNATDQAKKGRTGKLWILYIQMVKMLKNYITGDRVGDWAAHLNALDAMTPLFDAAGHYNYSKSVKLYRQEMSHLETRLTVEDYEKFITLGFFTISRTGKPWSGISPDMIIEQGLMREMKVHSGITHGRGVTASVLANFISTIPMCSRVRAAVEMFTGTAAASSEQHKDLRGSRKERDRTDFLKIRTWLTAHSPFQQPNEKLVSLSTGVVADSSVNCDRALEIGQRCVAGAVGKAFSELKSRRTNRVTPLAAMCRTVKVSGNTFIPINVGQLFHRMVLMLQEDKLEESFQYELAPTPASLFEDGLLRKSPKSSFVPALVKYCPTDGNMPQNPIFVVDGGFLLHRLVWPRPATFKDICDSYVAFVKSHYTGEIFIVFDGYSDVPTTKDAEQARRSAAKPCPDINFTESTPNITPQASFLANKENKRNLIAFLTTNFRKSGFIVDQAASDADTLIVDTAIRCSSEKGKDAVVVGNDTDLLVLMIGKSSSDSNVHMLIPGTASAPHDQLFHVREIVGALGDVSHVILFVYAFTGCDTTSSIFGKGKSAELHLLMKREDLRCIVAVFNDPQADPLHVCAAGERFLLALYNIETCASLNRARYLIYKRTIKRQPVTGKFKIATLPPTSDAARYHSFQAYHQVQLWSGNSLSPLLWGWELRGAHLHPVPTTRPPAPPSLLNSIVCNCTECEDNCSCRRSGLKCSEMCGQCAGSACSNAGISPLSELAEDIDGDLGDRDERSSSESEGEDLEVETYH